MASPTAGRTPNRFLITADVVWLIGNYSRSKKNLLIWESRHEPLSQSSAKQQRIRQLIAQFNADERQWQSLEQKRRRRRLHPKISAKCRRLLDLLDFENARPPEDCIGLFHS